MIFLSRENVINGKLNSPISSPISPIIQSLYPLLASLHPLPSLNLLHYPLLQPSTHTGNLKVTLDSALLSTP